MREKDMTEKILELSGSFVSFVQKISCASRPVTEEEFNRGHDLVKQMKEGFDSLGSKYLVNQNLIASKEPERREMREMREKDMTHKDLEDKILNINRQIESLLVQSSNCKGSECTDPEARKIRQKLCGLSLTKDRLKDKLDHLLKGED